MQFKREQPEQNASRAMNTKIFDDVFRWERAGEMLGKVQSIVRVICFIGVGGSGYVFGASSTSPHTAEIHMELNAFIMAERR